MREYCKSLEKKIYFENESADDQLFDEELISLIGKTDDDLVLLSERDQPVKCGEEDHQGNDIGRGIGSVDDETHQRHQINGGFGRSPIPNSNA